MSIESWWPRLTPESRDYLIANNGDLVPPTIVEEMVGLGAAVNLDAWWVEAKGPQGLYLSDEAIDWVEAVANGETPEPRG